MRNFFSSLLIMMLFSLLTACGQEAVEGKGKPKQEKREVKSFSSISVAGDYVISGNQGIPKKLVISSNPNILPYIESYVDNGMLIIKNDDSVKLQPSVQQNIWFTTKKLNAIKLNGASRLQMTNLKSQKLECDLNGAHKIALQGRSKKLKVTIKGSSTVNAKQLDARDAEIEINGSGMVAINVAKNLKVTINGDGQVVYYGKQPKIEQVINGSGQVRSGFGVLDKHQKSKPEPKAFNE